MGIREQAVSPHGCPWSPGSGRSAEGAGPSLIFVSPVLSTGMPMSLCQLPWAGSPHPPTPSREDRKFCLFRGLVSDTENSQEIY